MYENGCKQCAKSNVFSGNFNFLALLSRPIKIASFVNTGGETRHTYGIGVVAMASSYDVSVPNNTCIKTSYNLECITYYELARGCAMLLVAGMQWFQQPSCRARLQRTGTSNTKLLDTELLFLGRSVDNPRLRLVLPEVAIAVVLQEVG